MPDRISVVVIAHGAGGALDETLASLAAQSYGELEVLVVDDGAGAGAEAALPDERFGMIRRGAPSRGAARGIGAAAATGEFLAFADGGDLLPPAALETLHAALAASGSDFATGNVAERNVAGRGSERPAPAAPYRKAFAQRRARSRISRHPDLLADRHVTNRLFRRAFWDRHGFEFPDVNRYDDLAVAISAHYLAGTVEVVPDIVVCRRHGTAPEPATEPAEIADGFAAVAAVAERLAGHWRARDLRRFQRTALDAELRAFLDALPDADAAERAQIVELAAAYAEGIEPRVFARLPALTRLKWHLAGRRLTTELVKVVRFERGGTSPSIVRDPVRRYVVYPYWKDDKLAIPRKVYQARDEISLRGRVHEAAWRDGRLTVAGEAYINSVSMRRRWTSMKGVVLRSGRRRVPVRARQTHPPGKKSGSWTGFEFRFDPRRLRRRGRWVEGSWDVHAAVFNAGVFRRDALRGGQSGSGAHPPYHYVADDVRIVPLVVDGRLRIQVERVAARATALRWSGDELIIEGTGHVPRELALRLAGTAVPVPVSGADGAFTARVTPEMLAGLAESAGASAGHADPDAIDDTLDWTVAADGRPLVLAEGVPDAGRLVGVREAEAGRSAAGYLRLRLGGARLRVTGCDGRPDGTFIITGRHPVYDGGEIVLRSRRHRRDHAFAARAAGPPGGALRAELPAAAVPTLAGVLPLRPGRWDVLFRPPGGGRALAVRLDPAATLPGAVEVALRGYALEDHDGRPVLKVDGDVKQDERTAGPRLREAARLVAARDGLRDAVLFSCFNGKQYSDSPKAIHQELVRRGVDVPQLWVVNDAQVELPGTLEAVRLHGREWHEAVASCRYIVTNHRLGDWFQRHPDQVVLQTWHGTPLKKVGRDLKEVHFAYAPGMKKALQAKAAATGPKLPEWSHLLSPNPFSTEIFRRAFAFKGEIIEVGYPRNDLLHGAEADAMAGRVRARLGLPAGKRVILYAPTWRDDQYYSRGRYKFDMRIDLDRARAALGDDHVLLVRLHTNVVDGVAEDEFVRDVSLWPDITELYLISDMLVSDYSSVMFDYANTRRPMLFFAYDLADYRDRLRGFYFDFEKEAPGPLLETSDALIEAIGDVTAAAAGYRDNYTAFVERFCPLDDGKAAYRVVDQVFDGR